MYVIFLFAENFNVSFFLFPLYLIYFYSIIIKTKYLPVLFVYKISDFINFLFINWISSDVRQIGKLHMKSSKFYKTNQRSLFKFKRYKNLCMLVCLTVYLNLSVCLSICLSVHLSVCPSVCLSVYLSV